MASVIAQALAVLRCDVFGSSSSRLARYLSVRFPSRSGQTHLVPLSALRFSSDSLRFSHLTWSVALAKGCMRWKRSTIWAARGISEATPREYALSHVAGELGECPAAVAVLLELVAEPACAPLSLPCMTATTLLAGHGLPSC